MKFLVVTLKILLIIALVALMAAPLLVEYFSYRKDKKAGISYKRFRIILYTLVYIIAITVAMYFLKEFFLWVESLSWIQWIVKKLAVSARTNYFGKVLITILVNFGIGFLYVFLQKLVRIGLAKKDLVTPKGKDGGYTKAQKRERKVIRFFHTETWFFVGKVLKWFAILLSAIYAILFVLYQIPAFFGADWLPYKYMVVLFSAGYLYPVITLLALWEGYFFLNGLSRLEKECPELLEDEQMETTTKPVDLIAIDQEAQKNYKSYFAGEVKGSDLNGGAVVSREHSPLTRYIGQAVENDQRNPQMLKEVYLNCMDQIENTENSVIINGNFFSEFSMYLLRYLSINIARGDNIVFVCSHEAQIDQVYDYVRRGLEQLSSLYCKEFAKDAVDYDDPIWRIVKISGEHDVLEEAMIDDSSVLVTTLRYLCSADFDSRHSRFLHLLDTVVFVDTLPTINHCERQMSIFNTGLNHSAKLNAIRAKNSKLNERFRVKYCARPVRYICFDDTRTPGIDKVLKNLFAVEFDSVDAMQFNPQTMIRCYNYESKRGEDGKRIYSKYTKSKELVGVAMNMAVLCMSKRAGTVSVYAGDNVPYANFAETLTANMGQISVAVGSRDIRVNQYSYNPDDYSVIIAVDDRDNLPAVIRKYAAMASDKPTLLMVLSRPYMLRDFYMAHIDRLWQGWQIMRIPLGEHTVKDVAQKILVKANAGGITEEEIYRLAAEVPQLAQFAAQKNTNAILRAILEANGISQQSSVNLYNYFEYSTTKDFNENGVYVSQDRVELRKKGQLFDIISGRDNVIMMVGDREYILPIPKSRLSQNYIQNQNLLFEGNIYHIQRVDSKAGKLYAHLATSGINNEAYQYQQVRTYRVEAGSDRIESVLETQPVDLYCKDGDIFVDKASIVVFRAPTEVITNGYYELDPQLMAVNYSRLQYHNFSEDQSSSRAKQTYRRYGNLESPYYSSESIFTEEDRVLTNERGALIMSVKLTGKFGGDSDKTAALAAAMLNEILHSMFPSVADSLAVCPVLHQELADEENLQVMRMQPRLTLLNGGTDEGSENDQLELYIIEDDKSDLGVISVLTSSGEDLLNTLFSPIYDYLNWYGQAAEKSDYLYYGLDHEPTCFDFASLHTLSKLLGESEHGEIFVDINSIVEYEVCDFCGKRHTKQGSVIQLDDGRNMCKECAANLVGNNKKMLKTYLDRAKIYLESTYDIVLGDDYEFCFESTVKIVNTLRKHPELMGRGSDIPLKSYIDDKKKVFVEYSIPSANLSELLVRELTHTWQLKNIPNVEEDLAEGHIALVGLQYLRFLKQHTLATVRTNYYESTNDLSGEGYRRLARELLNHPQYRNNPFKFLLSYTGNIEEEEEEERRQKCIPILLQTGDFGKPYTPDQPDRVLHGAPAYFYYPRLTATMRRAYDVMLEGIQNFSSTVRVDGCSEADISKVHRAILYDRPDLYYYRTYGTDGKRVDLYYGATAEEVEVLNRRIDEVVPRYLEGIDDSMSAYDVLIRLHAKIIQAVDYDTIALNKETAEGGPVADKIDYLRSICGVFLDGKAVCAGYAWALQYLLQKCGVEAAYCSGDMNESDGSHAWNIVKIDGDYYYLDATWDDSSDTIQTVKKTDLGYNYYCVTTDEVCRSRQLNGCPVDMPMCHAIRANYYNHNDLMLDSYDLEKLKTIALQAVERQAKAFTFKCNSQKLYDEIFESFCVDGASCFEILKQAAKKNKEINPGYFSYRYDPKIRTITVLFNFK